MANLHSEEVLITGVKQITEARAVTGQIQLAIQPGSARAQSFINAAHCARELHPNLDEVLRNLREGREAVATIITTLFVHDQTAIGPGVKIQPGEKVKMMVRSDLFVDAVLKA